MAEKNFSCIKQVVKIVQIPLPSTFISNEISGITEILDSWKRQYSKQLQSVVVNYRNLSLSPNGFLVPNKPFVYYNVKATFDLFCPKIGDIVKGLISHISKEHILCLIEGTISVSIHLYRDSSLELAPFICLNREILFEISSLKFDSKMILNVRGKITCECIQLMKEYFPPPAFNNLADTPEFSNNTDEGIGTSSESADDRLLNHAFDDSKIDDMNFKKPLSSSRKTKKQSKRSKNDSESSSMDTSDKLNSDEKPKKKKKKHSNKSYPDVENNSNENNLPSDTVSSDTLIQGFSSFSHSEILDAIKEENSPFEDNTSLKKHKNKHKRDSSPSLLGEPTKSSNQNLAQHLSRLDLNNSTELEVLKPSKKRKRESDSSFMDTSDQSTSDEMPKKKKKHKETTPLKEKEIKNELPGMSVDETITTTVLSLKEEISSPAKTIDNFDSKRKPKKKSKDKKSKSKDKSKKKKGKVLASGTVLEKDKKSQKKSLKKNKSDGEQSKKHKKSKSHKKDKSDKKKKKDSSKS